MNNEIPSFKLNDFQIGHKFRNYQLLEQIGQGGQGMVWSALEPGKERIVAIKFKELGTDVADLRADDVLFDRQVGPLLELRHEHVLPILDFGQFGQIQYLVSPFIPGGSLLERIRLTAIPMAEALDYARQIASALSYLHGHGVIHRDLKPSNVLMDDDRNLYLADFGLARVVTETTAAMHTGHGTPPYAPPEQHTMDAITIQSDIFSFGVMLYELFTRQLPWDGKRTLGIQQLHTQDQIPDPREVNPALPPNLALLLRLMTAARPQDRPRSVNEILPMLEYVFKGHPMEPSREGQQPLSQPETPPTSPGTVEIGTVALNLTRFALVELEKKETVEETPTGDTASFMLYNALTFDYKHEYWWSLVKDPSKRLEVAASLVMRRDDKILSRVLHHITHDPEFRTLPDPLPAPLKNDLLEIATSTSNPIARRLCLEALRVLTPPAHNWQDASLDPATIEALASMALEDTLTGDQAARLIGHWRLRPATEAIYKLADPDRQVPALLEVQAESGGLPASLPLGTRLGVTSEWVWGRLRAQPLSLLATFLLSFLGAGLTFGIKEYLSTSEASFLNMLNVTLAMERGALLGAPYAIGVLLTRLIVERFPERRPLQRVIAAGLAGGVFLSISIFTYDVLVLTTIPDGFLYIASCFLIALGYALGGLKTARLWKIAAASLATFAAVTGSWWTYLNLASSSYTLSPVFYYKPTWTQVQILGTILLFTLGTAILGNIPKLAVQE